jgi:hypothetical protein
MSHISLSDKMRDMLLRACLPFQWNGRCTYITHASHMRKMKTWVIRVRLALGAHALKFQSMCSLSQYLAIFQNRQALSPFCRPRHRFTAATCHPRSLPQSTPPSRLWPWSPPLPHPQPQSTTLPHPWPCRWPSPQPQLPSFLDCAIIIHLWPSTPPPARLHLEGQQHKVPMPPWS